MASDLASHQITWPEKKIIVSILQNAVFSVTEETKFEDDTPYLHNSKQLISFPKSKARII